MALETTLTESYQKLLDELDDMPAREVIAIITGTPLEATGCTDHEHLDLVRQQRDQLRLDEATLAAILFGDQNTAGKGFNEIAAKIRSVLAAQVKTQEA